MMNARFYDKNIVFIFKKRFLYNNGKAENMPVVAGHLAYVQLKLKLGILWG